MVYAVVEALLSVTLKSTCIISGLPTAANANANICLLCADFSFKIHNNVRTV